MEETIEIRSKYQYFRVLVMGRANAGKTTTLQAVCGTTEAPEVYNRRGRKVGAKKSILSPTSQRGLHNIENELRFHSSPGFVFHDSRGFEAGATEELEKVRAFIDSRAAERSVDKQLHAIWFCLPTDNEARMLAAAELDFFERCDTGKVPVIAVFTKFDSLDSKAFQELRDEGVDFLRAQERAPRRADEHFERVHLSRIFQRRYPPVNELRVRNMHDTERYGEVVKRTVAELLKKTSSALHTDALRLLLATVQNNNVELCLENAVNSGRITAAAQQVLESGVFLQGKKLEIFLRDVAIHYPYIWFAKEDLDQHVSLGRNLLIKIFEVLDVMGIARSIEAFGSRRPFLPLRNELGLVHFSDGSSSLFIEGLMGLVIPLLPKLGGDLPPTLQVLNFGACVAICCGALFWQKTGSIGAEDFQRLLEQYEQSGTGAHVRAAVRGGFDEIGPYNTKEQNAKLLQIVLDNKYMYTGPMLK